MRNLKRVLSLALALVMVLGMMVITTSAADFTDADEITYTEAVDVMSALGVFKGDNGALKPTQVLTRKEAAVIVARIILGEKMAESLVPTKQLFDDVATTEWYAAEVEYCNNINMIVGHDGKFNPDGELTGTAFAKLILCAMGYDADAQGYANNEKWDANINADAMRNGLNIKGVNINAPLTREGAAQMLFQALDVDLVEYEKIFDKATGANVLYGPYGTNETFGSEFFGGLAKVEGIICGFDMTYGDTIFYVGDDKDGEPIHWEVSYTGADFDKIGYAAYVWALPGGAEDVSYWNAISDLTVTGESLGDSTEGLGTYYLTSKYLGSSKNPYFVAEIDTAGCSVFYNGEYVGEYWDKNDDVKDVLAKAANIGAKVDFVDNDNKGKAEAIVITEYTFDVVKDVQKVSASGNVYTLYYELTNKMYSKDSEWRIYADELYNVDSLSKGDFITFVEYDDYYIVDVLEAAEGEFESITRSKLSEETVKVYTIDGEDYIISEMDYVDAANFLKTNKINDDIVYVVDEYGYIVYAANPAADPDSYVFVLDNEDSHGIKDIAETELAFVDGTVDIVDVDATDFIPTGENQVEDGALADAIYTYTVKNGAYFLEAVTTFDMDEVDYTKKSLKMNGVGLTLGTVVVDLRDYLAGDADEGTVYTGYKQIPSFVDGTVYYLKNAAGKMALAFLVDGEDPSAAANLAASFVVFNTETNEVDEDKFGNLTYELKAGVLVEGEVVYDYILTQTQKDAIDALGVGVYTFAKDGTLASYTTFEEDTIYWTPESSGALVKNDKDITDDYTAIFLNIEEGEINDWYRYVEEGEYFCWIDTDNDIVYVVADGVATDDEEVHVYYAKNAKVVTIYKGVAYYSAPGHVTNKTAQKLDAAFEKAQDNKLTLYVYENGVFAPMVTTAGAALVEDAAALDAAITAGEDTIVLAPNTEYTVSTIQAADDIVIVGSSGTVITNALDLRGDSGDVSITFENVTLEGGVGNWSAVKDITLKNCVVEGDFHVDVLLGTLTAEGCTFAGKVQIGTGADAKVSMTDCVFAATENTSIWSDKGIRVYAPAEFDGCEFNNRVVLAGSNGLELVFDDCTMNGGDDVTENIIAGGNVPEVTIK